VKPWPGRLVLLGHPVAHSLSPHFQNAALRHAGIPIVYEALDVSDADLERTIRELRSIGAAGNVTIPHKEAVSMQCDELTALARRANAVNTFWCEGGRLIGDNTDVGGFNAVAADLLGSTLGSQAVSVALFGAGGAAAAVLTALELWPAARARVFSRSADRTRRLCSRFASVADAARTIEECVRGANLLVNATPVGLQDDSMPVDPAAVDPAATLIDLVYRPGGTPWTLAARRLGLVATDGRGVLLEQGALAFERWFGIQPNRDVMRAALWQ
jgi:shikimate dehydrogenase